MFGRIADRPGARCLLSGGGAARLEELLGMPLARIDNLVLKGLAIVARDDAAA
jgi:type III pantothenate kinase